jgi:hypothetical protein
VGGRPFFRREVEWTWWDAASGLRPPGGAGQRRCWLAATAAWSARNAISDWRCNCVT